MGRIHAWLLVLLNLAAFAGCGGDSGDEAKTRIIAYTVNSDANLPDDGRGASVVYVKESNEDCDSDNAPIRGGGGTVETAGTVEYDGKHKYTSYLFETHYIDVDGSGNLNNGDLVWGPDGGQGGIWGACFKVSERESEDEFDWDVVAEEGFGGSSEYDGPGFDVLNEGSNVLREIASSGWTSFGGVSTQ